MVHCRICGGKVVLMFFLPVNPAVLSPSTRTPSDSRVSSSGRQHTGSSGSFGRPTDFARSQLSANTVISGYNASQSSATPNRGVGVGAAYRYASGGGGSSGGGAVSSASSVTRLPVYPYADIASQYGMDQATAYREALANTAHMREVQDLQRAGLNPVLSATGGSGAASFAGDVAYPMSFGATTASGGGSASAAYYGGGSGGKRGSSAAGLASMLKDYNVQKAVASVASAAVGAATKSFPLGAAAYYGAQAVLGGLFRR